jgi:outer membrane beta-barrel protein
MTATGTFLMVLSTASFAYERVTDNSEVVLNKLFPKKEKVEFDGKLGFVLNSSYIQTFLATGGFTYFLSEEWGITGEASAALNQDKTERQAIEKFYNDPNDAIGDEHGEYDTIKESGDPDANWGPAYVPIRELKYIFTLNAAWNPIYGKQIILLSATNYFDFFINFGGGFAMSSFYPKKPSYNVGNGEISYRGTFCTKAQQQKGICSLKGPNPGTDNEDLVGEAGRPEAESQTNVLAHATIGQRFHFFRRFLLTGTLENYTLLGTESGFDNFLVISGGVGIRF